MFTDFFTRGLGFLTLLACIGPVAGCGGPGIFGSFGVSCDELSSGGWKALENGDRRDEAEAIKECGNLAGMTKREVVSWMGQPTRLGNQDTWTTGSSPTNSDLPTITVEYGRDGVVSAIYVDGY